MSRPLLAATAGLGLMVALAAGASSAQAGSGPAAASAGRQPSLAAGVISTVAGGPGGPGRATSVSLSPVLSGNVQEPCGLAYGAGRLYVGDSSTVRAVYPQTGWLATVAGTGDAGPLGEAKSAVTATVRACGVAVDHSGNLVIADRGNQRVRVVAATTGTFYGKAMTTRHIYTVAGDGTAGFSGDAGPAASAELSGPQDVAVDAAGNLVIADQGNQRVRVVAATTGTFYGKAMTTGDIYTVAGDGTSGDSGNGGPATEAELANPAAVAMDGAGNLVIAESAGELVRVVAVTTGTFYGQAMTSGDIYTIAGTTGQGFSGDGGLATRAELDQPLGVVVDGAGNMVFTDGYNHRVRVVAESTGTFYGRPMTAGHIYTIAGDGTQGFSGDGGPAIRAELSNPNFLGLDRAGNLLIADQLNGRIRVVAVTTGTFYGKAMTAGDIYTVAGGGDSDPGDGGPATSAVLNAPAGAVVDAAGNLVIADDNDYRVEVVAESTGTFYQQAMIAGDIYTVAGTGTPGFTGDGGPAAQAELHNPAGIAVDGAGNLLIPDSFNYRIRVVAESTGTFYGQAMTTGDIYTIGGTGTRGYSGNGGPATAAELNSPYCVAVDGAGNVVIADTFNNRVRVIAESTGTFYGQAMTTGDIYTIAGTGTRGFSGDGGLATHAELNEPNWVAVNGGNLLITDRYNNRVRLVTG